MDASLTDHHPAQADAVRLASEADIPSLVDICRGSFPLSFRWQGLRMIAERWWRAVLATPAAETCVFELDGVVQGFYVLVTDTTLWGDQGTGRKPPLLAGLLSVLVCPVVVMAKIRERLAAAWKRDPGPAGRGDAEGIRPSAWVELIAVGPGMRGRGVARTLLKACEARTVELGGSAIGLSVDAENEAAIRLYEAVGYARESATRFHRVYVKRLLASSQGGEAPADGTVRRADRGRCA